jgi:hypothetical protein
MKLFYSLILSVSSIYYCTAQTAVTFPDSNAVWVTGTYIYYQLSYQHSITSYCMNDEDTTIGSYTYSKINYCGGSYKGATRTESGKVYYIPKDSTQDFLLYDFSVQQGDLIYNVYYESGMYGAVYGDPIQAGEISETLINGVAHKTIDVYGVHWIEGIGNTNGLFAGIETLEFFAYNQLDCMSQNDTTLYPDFSLHPCNITLANTQEQENKKLQVFPNPTQQSTTIQWDDSWKEVSVKIYNASGNAIYPKIVYPSDGNAEIDFTIYPQGIYQVIVNSDNKNYSTRIIKQ